MSQVPLVRKIHSFGLVRVDTRSFPLVFMDMLAGKLSDEDFRAGLGVCEDVLRSGSPSFQVTDLSLVTDAPPSQRKTAGEWTERTAGLQRQWSLGGAVVAPSAFIRGVLTAIHWLKKPPSPTSVFATREEAISHALAVLDAAKVPISDDARALVRRDQRSLSR